MTGRDRRSLFVVGDDDQLIYGWRFADSRNILGFHDRYAPPPLSQTYTLSTNYRSSRSIVEASARVIRHNKNRVPKDIRPAPDAGDGEVRYVSSPDWSERAQVVEGFLREGRKSGSRWSEMAVLCRYKAQQPLVALILDRAGIPRTKLLHYRLFSDQRVTLLRAYITLVITPARLTGEEAALLINRPNRYVSGEDVKSVGASAAPWTALKALASQKGGWGDLAKLVAKVETLRERYLAAPPSPVALVDEIVLEFQLERFWTDKHPDANAGGQDADASHHLHLIKQLAQHAETGAAFLADWDRRAAEESESEETADDSLARETTADAVVIGTMHASKGREYDAVVLYEYSRNLSALTEPDQEEERRVFYVGLTRARYAAMLTIDTNGRATPLLIVESIEPAKPKERAEIEARLKGIAHDLATGRETRATLEREMQHVKSGNAATERKAELALQQEAVARKGREVADVRSLVLRPTLMHRLSGDLKQARRALVQAEAELEEAIGKRDVTAADVRVLEFSPEQHVGPIEREIENLDELAQALNDERLRHETRLRELKLLGGT